MSLTFLNPLFLLGLSGGILPILIHRLTKRKAIKRVFPSLRLLVKSQNIHSRPESLKHILLLILRIILILTIAFMMAQPILVRSGLFTAGEEGVKILVIDNSMSMGYMDEGGTRFNRAKILTEEVIKGVKGQFIIIPTFKKIEKPYQNVPILSKEEALRELSRISLSPERGDPGKSLSLAFKGIKENGSRGDILFISDMARGDWKGFDPSQLGIVPSENKVTFLSIGQRESDSNLSIKGVNLREGDMVLGSHINLEVIISNHSDKKLNSLVKLYLSGIKRDEKSVEIDAQAEERVYFELLLDKSGWVDGKVELSGDRLSADDVFYFSFKVRDKIKVLIVDGDPRLSIRATESYYLKNALNPRGSTGSPFLLDVISEGDLILIDQKTYDAFFLLNMRRLPEEKLFSILKGGKPVFIFLGDQVIPQEYNNLSFLPWRIEGLREGETLKIAEIDETHGFLKSFSGAEGESLRRATFRNYFKIGGLGKRLLIFENGEPFLLEEEIEGGRLFLFSSSADIDWNDLPLKASYLPLIQGLLKYSLNINRDSFSKNIRYKELPEGDFIQIEGERGGPGIYKSTSKSEDMRYCLNSSFDESDLNKISARDLKKIFGNIDIRVSEYRGEEVEELLGVQKELWPYILGFVLMVFGIEMTLSNILPKGE